MKCAMCEAVLPLIESPLLTVVVTDPDGETYAGHICSTDCLIDYAAKVRGLEMENET